MGDFANILKGDSPGHTFHGNQHTGGSGGGSSDSGGSKNSKVDARHTATASQHYKAGDAHYKAAHEEWTKNGNTPKYQDHMAAHHAHVDAGEAHAKAAGKWSVSNTEAAHAASGKATFASSVIAKKSESVFKGII